MVFRQLSNLYPFSKTDPAFWFHSISCWIVVLWMSDLPDLQILFTPHLNTIYEVYSFWTYWNLSVSRYSSLICTWRNAFWRSPSNNISLNVVLVRIPYEVFEVPDLSPNNQSVINLCFFSWMCIKYNSQLCTFTIFINNYLVW